VHDLQKISFESVVISSSSVLNNNFFRVNLKEFRVVAALIALSRVPFSHCCRDE